MLAQRGIDADTDACGDVQIVPLNDMSVRQGVQDPLGCNGPVFGMCHLLKQDNELVASLATDGVRSAHAFEQLPGNGLKQFIANRMSQRIIDVLESIQIEEEYREQSGITMCPGDGLVKAVIEEQAIGQSGEKVVFRQMSHPRCQCACHGYVAKNENRSVNKPVPVVNRSDGIFDEDFMAVATDQNTVDRKRTDLVVLRDHGHRIQYGFAGDCVDDPERFAHGPANCFIQGEASHSFRDGVEEGDVSFNIGTDNPVGNAVKRDLSSLLFLEYGF